MACTTTTTTSRYLLLTTYFEQVADNLKMLGEGKPLSWVIRNASLPFK